MAIADSFHCKNIPDCVVQLTQLKPLLEKARSVGSDFNIPSRKKIGGKMLFLQHLCLSLLTNYQVIYWI